MICDNALAHSRIDVMRWLRHSRQMIVDEAQSVSRAEWRLARGQFVEGRAQSV